MSEERFDAFLRRSAAEVPPPKLGEMERIWRAVDSMGKPQRRGWKVLIPVAAMMAVAVVLYARLPSQREREIDRVLTAAIRYETEAEVDFF